MAHLPTPTLAADLERIAARIHALAFDAAEQSRHQARSERIVDDVEQAAEDLRATVRGKRHG